MKTHDIVVKDTSRLAEYGFEQVYRNTYFLRAKRNSTLWLRVERGKLQIISASKPSIKVICEMYANGVIEFVDYAKETKYAFMLTKEERDLIKHFREGDLTND